MLRPPSNLVGSLQLSAGISYTRPRNAVSSARDVINAFLCNTSSLALDPVESTDLLSPTQSRLLSLTLQPYIPYEIPYAKDTVPQGHHLVYFLTGAVPESRLGSDGTETTYNPGPPFSRRMWAGGRIEWPKEVDLLPGKRTKEIMKLDKIESKTRGGGGEMILMSIEKTLFTHEDFEAVRETRQWVFLKEGETLAAHSSSTKKSSASRATVFEHSITLTPAALYRYSALIFNSHAIHLSKEHCLKEGHPNLVVHGPLTFSLLLEAIRGTISNRWKKVSYRAVGPAYVGDTIRLYVGVEKEGKADAWVEKADGIPVMTVKIEFW